MQETKVYILEEVKKELSSLKRNSSGCRSSNNEESEDDIFSKYPENRADQCRHFESIFKCLNCNIWGIGYMSWNERIISQIQYGHSLLSIHWKIVQPWRKNFSKKPWQLERRNFRKTTTKCNPDIRDPDIREFFLIWSQIKIKSQLMIKWNL